MGIEADIAKARKRPMAEEKMKELLTKLRKGASSTLTFGKLVQVLDVLGWQVEPILGWTPRHYDYVSASRGEEKVLKPVADTIRYSPEGLEDLHVKLMRQQVGVLPEAPSKVGDVAIMGVEEIQEGAEHRGSRIRYFHWLEWVGTEGVEVRAPSGESRFFLPDHHDLDRGWKNLTQDYAASHDIWRELLKSGIEEAVNAALGTEKHEPAAPRTRENTGTCPACWGNYKLKGGRLVLHGYQRPGYGFVEGRCFCEGGLPLETSDECARSYRGLLVEHLERGKRALKALENGEVEAIEAGSRGKVIKKGEPAWDYTLRQQIERTKRTNKSLAEDVDLYDKVIAAWKPRPMPKEGELQRSVGFFLK